MAKISTYPILSDPTINDILIGTDVEDLNITKNFSIGSIVDIVGGEFVPYVGATGNVNLGAFNITSSSFIVAGGLASQFLKANGTLDSTVYVPASRTITINGITFDLSENRSWDLNTINSLTTIGTSGAATYIGKTLNIPQYQAQGSYITQLNGEATAVGPGNATVTLSNLAVISKVLTGLNVTGGTISDTDSILTAFGKVQNQINGLAGGVTYEGTWNAATNNPTLTSSVGVQGHYYVVSVPGTTNLNGITDWQLGDWAIFNGSVWQKVDNTDAVVSVNGYTGAVVLTFSDVGAPPATRTLTINGITFDLTADRSWTVGDVRTDQTYSNPTWISSLAWGKITGTPTTLAGYGITDGVSSSRTLTINGTTFDLSANRTWNVGTVTSVGTSGPLTGGTITGSGTIGITQAGASSDGYLSSTDWNTFNNKQNALTNPVTGTGTIFTLPMWSGATSLVDSPLSYGPDAFNFQYNSATGGTVNFTNIGLTPYTYAIQMNNFGSPRSTVHSYTDGVVVQSIGGTQVSRLFANGNFILGTGVVDNGYKLEVTGTLALRASASASAATQVPVFIADPSGTTRELVTRTPAQLLGDAGAISGTIASGQVAFGTAANTVGGDNGLFWDNTNKRLAINITSPSVALEVAGAGSLGVIRSLRTTGAGALSVADHAGRISLGTSSGSAAFIGAQIGILADATWTAGTSQPSSFVISNVSSGTTLTEKLRVYSTGNVVIQNGGTFNDAGFRLDVNGSTRFNGLSTIQGTTASDSGQLGAELLTTGTGDASWTGTSFATGYTHVVGSTTTLTSTLAGVVNTFYQITYTVTGRTAGSFTIAFGGFTSAALTATGAVGPQATTTGTLVITPTSDFNGTIVLSIRTISVSSASVTFNSSAGTVTNQIRISSINSNTIIGNGAGSRNTTGSGLAIYGRNAGQSNTTGFANSFFGEAAGFNNTIGSNNSFFGLSSGSNNTIGSNNSFFGTSAGQANTTGALNSFFGIQAGQNVTTGENNTIIGAQAGRNATTGIWNTYIGSIAGRENGTGSRNVFIGRQSGTFIANGTTALTVANNSIFIGFDTRANADSQTNQIVIGDQVTGLGSNTTVLGNTSTTHGRWYGSLLLGTTTNAASSILTMESTTQGFLPPRMTSTQRNAIASPATGLIVYDTTLNDPFYFNGTAWTMFQDSFTLTTTGSSGPATLVGTTLNIPNYTTALTAYVPYTGATQDLDLGTYGLISDFVRFNPSSSNIPSAEGVMSWDNTDGTVRLSVKGNTYSVPIGQSVISRVRNSTGGNLLRTNYQVVKVAGAQGQRLAVSLAQANNDANSASTLGLVCENISNNQEGFIVNIGQVVSINTTGNLQGETWNDGDVLYLSPTILGAITNIKPVAPQHTVIIGYVEYAHANNGKIYVKIDNGYELEELHDVSAEPFINNGVLYRDTTLNLWKSATISTILGYTPAPQGNYITSLTGEATASGPGAASVTLSNSAVTGKVLTGLNVTGNAIVSTDSILTAFGKLQNQVNQLVGGLQYEGTWNAATNTPTITSSVGTDGTFYIVSVAGTTNINGINDWQVGDWIVFHDTSWQKVDNSDSVSSVFGRVGNIVANQSDYSAFYPLIGDIKDGVLTVEGTGVLSGSGTFSANQATNNTISLTHSNVSRTDTTSSQGPSFGGSFTVIDSVTSSAQGHITAVNLKTVTVPSTVATATQTGLLSNTDWTIFNNKQNALTNPVTGTGTINYLPKFTGTSAIGNSSLFDDGAGLGLGTASINASALFQMDSTTRGLLPPRMTQAQRTAIASPAEGLIVFQTNGVIGLYIYANATWRSLTMV